MSLRKVFSYLILIFLIVFVFDSCSSNKNTAASRQYHAMLTKFNIAYNGNVSFKEGMESIEKSNKDNYSELIPLYPISNHEAAAGAKGNMDRAIEKSRKAIKLHSIKAKPKRNYKRANDPKYRAFYNQTEFNPELKKAWMQLAKAEFHKADFLGSIGTFSYISRHFSTEPDVVTEAQLWMARAYLELDWIYEAENILKKIKKESVSSKISWLYAATWSEYLIKESDYDEAIPYLKAAIKNEKERKQRVRINYVLAQLLEHKGEKKESAKYYSQVIKANPSYEMAFNARIKRIEMLSKGTSAERELKRMAKNSNNKDYLDQLYTILGDLFMNAKDTTKAVNYYNLAIKESTRNGVEKGVALTRLGEFYYDLRKYPLAHPYYDEAAKIYTAEFHNFEEISHRAEVLGELVKDYDVVHLQDSLLALSEMPDKERNEAIKRVIEKLKEEEKRDEAKQLAAQRRQEEQPVNMAMAQIGRGTGGWYFYNPTTVNSGKNDFRQKWGNRKLEDNWRRKQKSAALFDNEMDFAESNDSIANDSIVANAESQDTNLQLDDESNVPDYEESDDPKQIGFYMAQIPFSQAQKERSNEMIATGLYNMGFVYKDRIEDYPLAYATFEEFEKRFADDERIPETLFQRFLMASKEEKKESAMQYRQAILTNYPDSKYADILADPNYIENQKQMFLVQDTLYNKTYAAFIDSDYESVFANTKKVKTSYPLAPLLPQFEFLNTLSIGKTKSSEEFEESLNFLVESYPDSKIGAMSKDILALLMQGNIAQQGKSFGSLLTKREQEKLSPEEQMAAVFSDLKFTPHRILFITDADDDGINKLQYNLAIFNFSRFMIKDFAFELTRIDETKRALSVLNLESYNEGIWYQNTLESDREMVALLDSMQIEQLIISEDNFDKLLTTLTLDEYIDFESEHLSKDIPKALLGAAKVPVEKETFVEIIDGTKILAEERKKEEEAELEKLAQRLKESETKMEEEKANEIVEELDNEADLSDNRDEKVEIKAEVQDEKVESQANVIKEEAAIEKLENRETEVAQTTIKTEEQVIHENIELYKDLFAYRPNSTHQVVFYIPPGGKFDFEKIKNAVNAYNTENYPTMNLQVKLETFDKLNLIFVHSFEDLNVSKSYFLRLLKDSSIIKATSGMNKRNLLITQENLDTLLQEEALDVYFEFMKKYYLSN